MFSESVVPRGNGPKPDWAGVVALSVSEMSWNVKLGRGRWFARKKLEPLGGVLLELLVGLEHGDDERVYVLHETAVSLVPERKPVG